METTEIIAAIVNVLLCAALISYFFIIRKLRKKLFALNEANKMLCKQINEMDPQKKQSKFTIELIGFSKKIVSEIEKKKAENYQIKQEERNSIKGALSLIPSAKLKAVLPNYEKDEKFEICQIIKEILEARNNQ